MNNLGSKFFLLYAKSSQFGIIELMLNSAYEL